MGLRTAYTGTGGIQHSFGYGMLELASCDGTNFKPGSSRNSSRVQVLPTETKELPVRPSKLTPDRVRERITPRMPSRAS